MLSSQMLWPRLCSNSVAFIVSPCCGCREVSRVVPQTDHRTRWIVFIRQRAQTRCAQEKVAGGLRLETEPPSGQDPEEVRAGEQQGRAFDGSDAAHDAICPRADFRESLSAGESIAKWLPAGAHRPYLGR